MDRMEELSPCVTWCMNCSVLGSGRCVSWREGGGGGQLPTPLPPFSYTSVPFVSFLHSILYMPKFFPKLGKLSNLTHNVCEI